MPEWVAKAAIGVVGLLIGFAIGVEYGSRTARFERQFQYPVIATPAPSSTSTIEPASQSAGANPGPPTMAEPPATAPHGESSPPPVESTEPAELPGLDPAPDTQVTTAGDDDEQPQRCTATTRAGTRCKRKARPGSRHCWQHQRRP